jgi:hypothetical protein
MRQILILQSLSMDYEVSSRVKAAKSNLLTSQIIQNLCIDTEPEVLEALFDNAVVPMEVKKTIRLKLPYLEYSDKDIILENQKKEEEIEQIKSLELQGKLDVFNLEIKEYHEEQNTLKELVVLGLSEEIKNLEEEIDSVCQIVENYEDIENSFLNTLSDIEEYEVYVENEVELEDFNKLNLINMENNLLTSMESISEEYEVYVEEETYYEEFPIKNTKLKMSEIKDKEQVVPTALLMNQPVKKNDMFASELLKRFN